VAPKVLPAAGYANPAYIPERGIKRCWIITVVVHIAPLTGIEWHDNRDRLVVARPEIISACISPPASIGVGEIIVPLLEENMNASRQYVVGIDHFVLRSCAVDPERYVHAVRDGSRVEWRLDIVNLACSRERK